VRLAGVGSVFFALSEARIAKLCEPPERGVEGVWLARARARGVGLGVEATLEGRVRLAGREAEGRGVVVRGRARGPGGDRVCRGVESSTY
jgi:hypothetical protein